LQRKKKEREERTMSLAGAAAAWKRRKKKQKRARSHKLVAGRKGEEKEEGLPDERGTKSCISLLLSWPECT
jgi:hypothetical protein